jgi:hypothetical protein
MVWCADPSRPTRDYLLFLDRLDLHVHPRGLDRAPRTICVPQLSLPGCSNFSKRGLKLVGVSIGTVHRHGPPTLSACAPAEEAVMIQFVGWRAGPPVSHPSHPQALLAGLMQGVAELEDDPALLDAGKRLCEAARKGPPAASRLHCWPKASAPP